MSKIVIKDLEFMQEVDSETTTTCVGGRSWGKANNNSSNNSGSQDIFVPFISFDNAFTIKDGDFSNPIKL